MAEVVADTPNRTQQCRESVSRIDQVARDVVDRVVGRSLQRVEYVVSPDIPDLETWCKDHGDMHELDYGVQFEMDDGFRWSATWVGPPCYVLGLVAGGVLREGSGEPLLGIDVSSKPWWLASIGQCIKSIHLRSEAVPADFMFGISKELLSATVDAEVCLENGKKFWLSTRMYFPGQQPEGQLLDDCVLVSFAESRAARLGVRIR